MCVCEREEGDQPLSCKKSNKQAPPNQDSSSRRARQQRKNSNISSRGHGLMFFLSLNSPYGRGAHSCAALAVKSCVAYEVTSLRRPLQDRVWASFRWPFRALPRTRAPGRRSVNATPHVVASELSSGGSFRPPHPPHPTGPPTYASVGSGRGHWEAQHTHTRQHTYTLGHAVYLHECPPPLNGPRGVWPKMGHGHPAARIFCGACVGNFHTKNQPARVVPGGGGR